MIENVKIRKLYKQLAERMMLISSAEAMETKGIHEKYWIKSGERSYLFKYNNHPKDYSDFGEVFVSYLSHVLGFKCVNSVFSQDFFYEEREKTHKVENYFKDKENAKSISQQKGGSSAQNTKVSNFIGTGEKTTLCGKTMNPNESCETDRTYLRYGSLTESYIKNKNCEVFSLRALYSKFSPKKIGSGAIYDIVEVCKFFCERYDIIMDNNLEAELKDMALIDYLLVQEDRHGGNIEFLVEEKKGEKYLSLAPMFDNGACLHLADNFKPEYILEDLEKPILYDIGIGKLNPTPAMYIKNNKRTLEKKDIIKDLANEILKDKRLGELYNNFKNLDISGEVEFLNSIYKRQLPNEYKKIINLSIKNRVDLLEKELDLQKQRYMEELDDYECGFTL